MSKDSALQAILDIDSGNAFLKYIVARVQRDGYRGIHLSQHNRYDLGFVREVFKQIYEVAGDASFAVPPGDYKQSEYESLERTHPQFVLMVRKIKANTGRTTVNSLKKTFFPDFARAGFISRYGKRKNLLDPMKIATVNYARLNAAAVDLVKAMDIAQQHYIFSKHINILLGGYIVDLANAIHYSDFGESQIEFVEFQYILSDDSADWDCKIELLKQYRRLKPFQKTRLRDLLKQYCNPDKFSGDKTTKRDYRNWANETQQVMNLLTNTIYFQITSGKFGLNTGAYGIFSTIPEHKRSQSAKQAYFKEHNIVKIADFDLHHIVPIAYAKNRSEFELIDKSKNLIYINKRTHRRIKSTQVKLEVNEPIVKFMDIDNESKQVRARNKEDASYNPALANAMMRYNSKLLKAVLGYPI